MACRAVNLLRCVLRSRLHRCCCLRLEFKASVKPYSQELKPLDVLYAVSSYLNAAGLVVQISSLSLVRKVSWLHPIELLERVVLILAVEFSTRPFHHTFELSVSFVENVDDYDWCKVIDKPWL